MRDESLPMTFVALKDHSSVVKVTLFDKEDETNYTAGDVMKVSSVYRFKDTPTLSTNKDRKVDARIYKTDLTITTPHY